MGGGGGGLRKIPSMREVWLSSAITLLMEKVLQHRMDSVHDMIV